MGFAASRGTKSPNFDCYVGGSKVGKAWKNMTFTIQDLCPRSYVLYNPAVIMCRLIQKYVYMYMCIHRLHMHMISCISTGWYMVDTYVICPQGISFGWQNGVWICPGFEKWLAAWSTRPSTTESSTCVSDCVKFLKNPPWTSRFMTTAKKSPRNCEVFGGNRFQSLWSLRIHPLLYTGQKKLPANLEKAWQHRHLDAWTRGSKKCPLGDPTRLWQGEVWELAARHAGWSNLVFQHHFNILTFNLAG